MARTNRPPVYVPGAAAPVAPVSPSVAEARDAAREAEAGSREALAADRHAVDTAAAPVSDAARAVAAATAAREVEGQRQVARIIERNRARGPQDPAATFDLEGATGAELDAFVDDLEADDVTVEGYRRSDKVDDRRAALAAHLGR